MYKQWKWDTILQTQITALYIRWSLQMCSLHWLVIVVQYLGAIFRSGSTLLAKDTFGFETFTVHVYRSIVNRTLPLIKINSTSLEQKVICSVYWFIFINFSFSHSFIFVTFREEKIRDIRRSRNISYLCLTKKKVSYFHVNLMLNLG